MSSAQSSSIGIVGFIRPPPDVRAVVDKTAAFVAKNGPEFEAKIAADKGSDAKFAFLRPENPYHGYYRHRVEEARSASAPPPSSSLSSTAPTLATISSSTPAPATAAAATAEETTTDISSASSSTFSGSNVSFGAPQRRVDITGLSLPSRALRSLDLSAPGPRDEYCVPLPEYAGAEAVDTIKLTAQYTAVNGRSFLVALTSREAHNAAFDFLKPSHALFPVFTALVDAYSRVLRPSVDMLERLARVSGGDPLPMLERAVGRLEHERDAAARRATDSAAHEAERAAHATIDWHEFVIAETIPFDEDDEALAALPPPMAAPTVAAPAHLGAQRLVAPLRGKPEQHSASTGAADAASGAAAPPEPLRIVVDYAPAAVVSKVAPVTTFLDKRTGRAIPLAAAAEALRVETLDPAWATQRQRFLARHADTALTTGDEVVENLRRLAARRADVFAAGRDGHEEAANLPPPMETAASVDVAVAAAQAGNEIGDAATHGPVAKRARTGGGDQ